MEQLFKNPNGGGELFVEPTVFVQAIKAGGIVCTSVRIDRYEEENLDLD